MTARGVLVGVELTHELVGRPIGAARDTHDLEIRMPSHPLTATTAQRGTCLSITLAGELDVTAAGLLEGILDRAPRCDLVVIDTAGVTFMDSTGVHALLKVHARTTAGGARLVIVCDEGPVLHTVRLCGVEERLNVTAGHPRPSLRLVA